MANLATAAAAAALRGALGYADIPSRGSCCCFFFFFFCFFFRCCFCLRFPTDTAAAAAAVVLGSSSMDGEVSGTGVAAEATSVAAAEAAA